MAWVHFHWLVQLLPTGQCLRSTGARILIDPDEAVSRIEAVRSEGVPYGVVGLSTAAHLYGEAALWRHAISFIGDGNGHERLFDPLSLNEPKLAEQIRIRSPLAFVGRFGALCGIFQAKRG